MIAKTKRPLRPFLDVLFCIIVVQMAILLLMKIPQEEGIKMPKIASRAMVLIEWENGAADIDLTGKDPNRFIVFHKSREGGDKRCYMSLDHDDLGDKNDSATRKDNQEIIQIRDYVPGDYHFTIHYYGWEDFSSDEDYGGDITEPIKVIAKLVQLKPKYKVLHETEVSLTEIGEERTIVRFSVDDDMKTVSNVNQDDGAILTDYTQFEDPQPIIP